MAERSCIYLIHSLRDSYSDKERVVAEYILARPSEAVHPSIEELAASIGVSVSTLLRFVKKLGYGGYQQFRIALATEALAPEARFYEASVTDTEDPVDIVFSAARDALSMTSKLLDRKALWASSKAVCGAETVYFFGLGGSGVVATDAVHKLVRSGIRCQTAQDFHLQLMMASQACPRDFAFVISNTGANKDTLAIVDLLKKSGCGFAAITTYPRSPLARVADYVLISAAPGAAIISEAFSARIAHLAIVDAIYVAVMETLKEGGLENVEKMRAAIAARRI